MRKSNKHIKVSSHFFLPEFLALCMRSNNNVLLQSSRTTFFRYLFTALKITVLILRNDDSKSSLV